ncbi:MAG: DUF192 domain-containing protein [Phycisphaeraceae bacterium]|nr:DUF192 domain-containing protein [Phycisphaeraceae bacterium]
MAATMMTSRRRVSPICVAVLASIAACQTGCEEAPDSHDGLVTVRFTDETFYLEPALDNPTRILGLGGREHIDSDGGMVFVFRDRAERSFVMRNCPIPIDIAYLSDTGRVVTMFEMQPEKPQGENESDMQYERRLKRYPSRYPVRFVMEFSGGRLHELGVSVGDEVRFDTEDLKRRAR